MLKSISILVICILLLLGYSCQKLENSYFTLDVFFNDTLELPRVTKSQLDAGTVPSSIPIKYDILFDDVQEVLEGFGIEYDNLDSIIIESVTFFILEDSVNNSLNQFNGAELNYVNRFTPEETLIPYFQWTYNSAEPRSSTFANFEKLLHINHVRDFDDFQEINLRFNFSLAGAPDQIGFSRSELYMVQVKLTLYGFLLRGANFDLL